MDVKLARIYTLMGQTHIKNFHTKSRKMGKAIVIKDVDFSSVKLTTILLKKEIVSLSAVYVQTKEVYPNTPLDSLKDDLTVTATFVDDTSAEITSYALSGTLSVGTSTITVSVRNVSTSFNVAVLDYKMSYSFANGDLRKEAAACSWVSANKHSKVAYVGLFPKDGYKRRTFVIDEGNSIPLYELEASSLAIVGVYTPNSYLIPVPPVATIVAANITPSQQYIGVSLYTYNPITQEFIRVVDAGWKQGSWNSGVFAAGTYQYLSVTSKYDLNGDSYPEEPTDIVIQFS